MWQPKSVIPALQRLRQEDDESKARPDIFKRKKKIWEELAKRKGTISVYYMKKLISIKNSN